jgi:DNA-binding MarR family transcriptional regulator
MSINEDILQIRNDIDRVRQDIDSINRVQVLASSAVILQDVRKTIGKSKQMVAALFLCKDFMSSSDLSQALDIDQGNIDKVVNPLIEGGLLYRERSGKSVRYKRATRLDLVGFDRVSEFLTIYESWKADLAKKRR